MSSLLINQLTNKVNNATYKQLVSLKKLFCGGLIFVPDIVKFECLNYIKFCNNISHTILELLSKLKPIINIVGLNKDNVLLSIHSNKTKVRKYM